MMPIDTKWTGRDLREWRLAIIGAGSTWMLPPEAFLEQPVFRHESRETIHPAPRRTLRGEVQVVLNVEYPETAALRDSISNEHAVYTGTLEVLFEEDSAMVARGRLTEVRYEGSRAFLTFSAGYPGNDRMLCRRALLLPGLENLQRDLWLPQVFGDAGFVLPPLFSIESALLWEELEPGDGVLQLDRPVSWPAAGRLQVNDEVLHYTHLTPGSTQIGSATHPLQRPEARKHRRGSRVMLLPGSSLAWCAADHEGELLELRLENEEGLSIGTEAAGHETLAGREALLVRRDRLPLAVVPGRSPVERESERTLQYWTILPETNAVAPGDAFTVRPPGRGAILSIAGPVIVAEFTEDFAKEEHRFDEILDARLSVEFSDSPNWAPSTRLMVEITKGERSIFMLFNRDGAAAMMTLEGRAHFPKNTARVTPRERRRIHFEAVTAEGPWFQPVAAIDARFQEAAEIDTPAGASLTTRFVTERPERMLRMEGLRLYARVTNSGEEALRMKLEVSPSGQRRRTAEVHADPGATVVAEMAIPLGDIESGEDHLGPGTVYRLYLPDGGKARVEEMWLEGDVYTNGEEVAGALETLPISLAMEGIRIPYNRVELEVTGLMEEEANRWDFFTGKGGPLRVRLEVLGAPAISGWGLYVRDVHWRQTVVPASGVRPTDRLWGLVRGRQGRPDGTANPAHAVREILEDPWMGALLTDALDEASFNAAADAAEARNLAVAAAFLERLPVETALESLLAESLLALVPSGDGWRLYTAPVDPEEELHPPFSDAVRLAGGMDEVFRPGSREERGGVLVHAPERSIRVPGAPPLTAVLRPRWLARGAVTLLRHAEALRQVTGRTAGLDADIPAMLLMPGQWREIGLPDGKKLAGEIASVLQDSGCVHLRMEHAREVTDFFRLEFFAVRRGTGRSGLIFFHRARPVARLADSGALYLRGTLKEGVLPAGPFTPLYIFLTGEDLLVLSHRNADGTGLSIAFDHEGNLLTQGPVQEAVATSVPAPSGAGERHDDHSAFGGPPDGNAAAVLTSGAFMLRGTLRTNQIF